MKFNITIDIDEEDEDLCGKSCPYLEGDSPDTPHLPDTPYCTLFGWVLNGCTNRCEDCKKLTYGVS